MFAPCTPSTAGTALVAVRSVVRPNDTCALYYLPLRGNRAPTRGAPAVDVAEWEGCLKCLVDVSAFHAIHCRDGPCGCPLGRQTE